ncbi:hypothetical protein L204_106165 [Cryptococcus depauperatus]
MPGSNWPNVVQTPTSRAGFSCLQDFISTLALYYQEFGLSMILTEFYMQCWDPEGPGPKNLEAVCDLIEMTD